MSNTLNWYEYAVGGMWEEMGQLQFDYLVEHGLRPEHYLLDVGCGSLRGGVRFIPYLQPGHYYGIDISADLLEAGRYVLQQNNLSDWKPVLVQMGDFDFLSLKQTFDYALAQSVFTHLPLNSIIRCIMSMEKVLVRGGKFYATFFENPPGKFNLEPLEPRLIPGVDGPPILTYFDQDPYHSDFGTFEWICQGTSLKVEYLGDWNHPRDQKLMVFTKM